MSKKEVSCTVLGHDDGPACPTCKKPMDSIKVKEGKLKDKKTFYCYHCFSKGSR